MVVLSGLSFLFRFFPVFFILYLITPRRFRMALLFAGSLLFYASASLKALPVLLAGVLFNYILGRLLCAAGEEGKHGRMKVMLAVSVLADVLLLTVCKILALRLDAAFLPLGMSFYIFKMISYQADLYTGKISIIPGFFDTAAYFTMFPQLTQGPIMRYTDAVRQFIHGPVIRAERVEEGVCNFAIGFAYKVLLADRIGILWNEITKIGFESISTPLAWMGAFAYSFQLYFDFFGYSLMAAGIGLMLGFPMIENFRDPYRACGIADFYRRWHATLGSWFRDYLYIPLGGSRKGNLRTVFNLMIVWAVTGLWHGGTVNFLIWGLVLGILIVIEKFILAGALKKAPFLGHIGVWVLIPLTWVVFAITRTTEIPVYFARLFPFFGQGIAVDKGDYLRYLPQYWQYFAVCFVLSITGVYSAVIKRRKNPLIVLLLAGVFFYALYFAASSAGNAFMYFTF